MRARNRRGSEKHCPVAMACDTLLPHRRPLSSSEPTSSHLLNHRKQTNDLWRTAVVIDDSIAWASSFPVWKEQSLAHQQMFAVA